MDDYEIERTSTYTEYGFLNYFTSEIQNNLSRFLKLSSVA